MSAQKASPEATKATTGVANKPSPKTKKSPATKDPKTSRQGKAKRNRDVDSDDESGERVGGKKKKVGGELVLDAPLPKQNTHGEWLFPDFPEFRPNWSPKEVLQAGSFGGTYFRPIYSSVTKERYGDEVWKELPEDWLKGLDVKSFISSNRYQDSVNTYKVSCGGDLEMWESSGWIQPVDPYGWFQWYCRFFQGRRSGDDSRQIARGLGVMGPKGRWRSTLSGKVLDSAAKSESPLNPR